MFEDFPIPNNCEVTGIPPRSLVGGKIGFTIITKNQNNDRYSKGGSQIIVQVQLSRGGDVFSVEVKDNNDGSYFASFVTTQVGEVKVSITIEGDHIKGSPYTFMVDKPNYKTMNKPRKIVNDDGKMGEPWGIAFGKDGVWAVAYPSVNCVAVFDCEGKVIRKFSQCGTGNGQLSRP